MKPDGYKQRFNGTGIPAYSGRVYYAHIGTFSERMRLLPARLIGVFSGKAAQKIKVRLTFPYKVYN
jgi:hypothetical protein